MYVQMKPNAASVLLLRCKWIFLAFLIFSNKIIVTVLRAHFDSYFY